MTDTATRPATAPTVSVVVGDVPTPTLPEAAHLIAREYLAEALSTPLPAPIPFLSSRELRRRLPSLSRRTFAQGMRALVAAGLYEPSQTPTGWHVRVTIPVPPQTIHLTAARTNRPHRNRLNVRMDHFELTPLGLPDVPGILTLLSVIPDHLEPCEPDAVALDLGPVTRVVPEIVNRLADMASEGYIIEITSPEPSTAGAYRVAVMERLREMGKAWKTPHQAHEEFQREARDMGWNEPWGTY